MNELYKKVSQRLLSVIGYGGLALNDHKVTYRWYGYFFRARMVLLVFLMCQWYFELRTALSYDQEFAANLVVWLFFVTETITLTALSCRKGVYLRRQWVNIFVIITGVPILLFTAFSSHDWMQALRLLLVVWLLIPWISVCYRSLSDNRLGTTLAAAMFIMILAGILISALDPSFPSPIEGIWWAWVTVSTVGYGDYVPVSMIGKIFAAGLILMGMALFSVITANFSSVFVSKGMREDFDLVKRESEAILTSMRTETDGIKDVLDSLHNIKVEEDDILQTVQQLHMRMAEIERLLLKKKRRRRRYLGKL